jgi:hypothetical protein
MGRDTPFRVARCARRSTRPRLLPGARPNLTTIAPTATGGGRAGGAAGHSLGKFGIRFADRKVQSDQWREFDTDVLISGTGD